MANAICPPQSILNPASRAIWLKVSPIVSCSCSKPPNDLPTLRKSQPSSTEKALRHWYPLLWTPLAPTPSKCPQPPLAPSTLPPSTPLQQHWAPCCPLNQPSMLQLQSLCPSTPLCLRTWPPRRPWRASPHFLQVFLQSHPTRGHF